MGLYLIAAVVVGLSKEEACSIPLTFWLAIHCLLTMLEILVKEMRERMNESPYWYTANRRLRKAIVNGSIILREVLEASWCVYGLVIYNSQPAESC